MSVSVAMDNSVRVWRIALTKAREGYAGRSLIHSSLTYINKGEYVGTEIVNY